MGCSSFLLLRAFAVVLLLQAAAARLSGAAAAAEAAGPAPAVCDRQEVDAACTASWKVGEPSAGCCAEVRKNERCYCTYLKDPAVRPYIESPEGRHFFSVCKVPFPVCSLT